jgi:hypothetical protein
MREYASQSPNGIIGHGIEQSLGGEHGGNERGETYDRGNA